MFMRKTKQELKTLRALIAKQQGEIAAIQGYLAVIVRYLSASRLNQTLPEMLAEHRAKVEDAVKEFNANSD